MDIPVRRKPRINAVYGKRQTGLRAAASARTRQVFAASSSDFGSNSSPPSSPAAPKTPPTGSSFITRDQSVRKIVHEDVDVLTEGVGALSIKKEAREERILSPRDVNVISPVLRKSPRKSVAAAPLPPATRSRRRLENAKTQEKEDGSEATLREHVQPLLDLCCDVSAAPGTRAESTSLTDFETWASSLDEYFYIVKIAEASYGEVYRLSLKSHQTFTRADESVLKIIALKPPSSVKISKKKLDAMSSVSSVLSEAQLLRRMTPVPGFTNFRDIRIVRGRPGPSFVAAWRHFDKNVKKSEFPDPGRKTSYDESQLWAVLEMQDAGTDLESVLERMPASQKTCPAAAWDVFWGTAIALAKGEEWAKFEHRDLHIGNICVRLKHASSSTTKIALEDALTSTCVFSKKSKLGQSGLETTIIDYTLSRAVLGQASSLRHDCGREEEVAFFDLAHDSAIFEGDATEEYQYELYRLMRSTVCGPGSKTQASSASSKRKKRPATASIKEDSEAWRKYHPLTNVVWLHYILTKLCPAAALSKEAEPLMKSKKTLKEGKNADADAILKRRLQRLCELLLLDDITAASTHLPSTTPVICDIQSSPSCSSCDANSSRSDDDVDDNNNKKEYDSDAKAALFRKNRIQSATALVEYAVAKGWLNEEDVVSCGLPASAICSTTAVTVAA